MGAGETRCPSWINAEGNRQNAGDRSLCTAAADSRQFGKISSAATLQPLAGPDLVASLGGGRSLPSESVPRSRWEFDVRAAGTVRQKQKRPRRAGAFRPPEAVTTSSAPSFRSCIWLPTSRIWGWLADCALLCAIVNLLNSRSMRAAIVRLVRTRQAGRNRDQVEVGLALSRVGIARAP